MQAIFCLRTEIPQGEKQSVPHERAVHLGAGLAGIIRMQLNRGAVFVSGEAPYGPGPESRSETRREVRHMTDAGDAGVRYMDAVCVPPPVEMQVIDGALKAREPPEHARKDRDDYVGHVAPS